MPLTKGQSAALTIIAAARDPESYIAGSTPLNLTHARYSNDIDIFHDSADRVEAAAQTDAAALAANGFDIRWVRRTRLMHTAIAARDGEDVGLDWIVDSDFRFFPVVADPVFGFTLHPVDLALNKISAVMNRRELRDIVDTATIHDAILPLGAAIWAAVEKAPGFTPEALIEEIRRNSVYPAAEWAALPAATPIDPGATLAKLRAALDEAETFVRRMPSEHVGLLFLNSVGEVVQPDPSRLSEYLTHRGQRRGHWPTSPEIAAAMMERLIVAPD